MPLSLCIIIIFMYIIRDNFPFFDWILTDLASVVYTLDQWWRKTSAGSVNDPSSVVQWPVCFFYWDGSTSQYAAISIWPYVDCQCCVSLIFFRFFYLLKKKYTVFSFLCFALQHLLIVFIESWIEPFQKKETQTRCLKKASVEPYSRSVMFQ